MAQNKLYVGNLPFDLSEDDIKSTFEAHGTVSSVNLITDRDTGLPRGFGFVEMGSAEEAQAAIAALDQTQVGGRTIRVNVAKGRPQGGGGRGGGGRRDRHY